MDRNTRFYEERLPSVSMEYTNLARCLRYFDIYYINSNVGLSAVTDAVKRN